MSFASSFWTADYAAGLGVLFSKLQQGVQENEQILTVARMRAEAEDAYGQRLGDIEGATNRIEGGFQRDDGASVKKAYEGVRTEMGEAARNHRKIASNIRELVVSPFNRWCDHHAARVQNSQDELQNRIRAYDRQQETVRQYRSAYFNKCRRVEDLDEEEKLAFQDPGSSAAAAATATAAATPGSPKPQPQSVPSIKVEQEEDEPEPVDIGDQTYQPEQVKKMLTHALNNIRLGETKVPILGTYQNVTTGAEIVEYIQKHMGGTNVSYAEKIGQDLINNGFLRLIGNMGNNFANSSKMNYQWRTKVFQITGIPEKRPKLIGRASTVSSMDSNATPDSPVIGDRVTEMWSSGWNPLNNPYPNETPGEKLRRERNDSDERYKGAIRKLDGMRCTLEESIVEHLKFMERCELDRLKAIKSVVLDFSGAISNVIPSLQSTVDNMMLFQETVQPPNDLRYLLENYRTGSYVPKVVTYENYYNQVDGQTFGVDIEAKARADRKRVPLIVTTILMFLDSHYPDLEGDEARRSIWTVEVPLTATHHLRNQINDGKPVEMETLDKYEVPIVAAVLKLYLLELPDSLVSAHLYEVVKAIYTSTAQSASEQARVQVIQSTLSQLRVANIATLDAITTHLTRMIDLTSADEAYIANLANILAPCLMRPKQETGLTMNEKFNVRLIRDLFAHKDEIFGELKRQASLNHSNTTASTRPNRAVSTDESKRKEAMEERHRAITAARDAQAAAGGNRSRQPSPAPGSRAPLPEGSSHRRDRSRGPETRFPVSTGSGGSVQSATAAKRESLNIPNSPPAPRQQATTTTSPPKHQTQEPSRTNGSIHQPPPAENDTYSSIPSKLHERTETIPMMSASMSGPEDFNAPIYEGVDSPPTSATSLKSKHKFDSDTPSGSATPTSAPGVSKKDSLGRARAPYTARSSGSLHKNNLETAPDDGKGVQLSDRPVEFD